MYIKLFSSRKEILKILLCFVFVFFLNRSIHSCSLQNTCKTFPLLRGNTSLTALRIQLLPVAQATMLDQKTCLSELLSSLKKKEYIVSDVLQPFSIYKFRLYSSFVFSTNKNSLPAFFSLVPRTLDSQTPPPPPKKIPHSICIICTLKPKLSFYCSVNCGFTFVYCTRCPINRYSNKSINWNCSFL